MSNPYYTRVFNPLPGQRVDEQVLKDEYQRVELGFDGVQTAIAAAVALVGGKANLAGGNVFTGAQDFTGGSVLVPTPTLASHAVSKAYADGLSFAAALPAQTGNAGKFVTTDGTTASWASIITPEMKGRTITGNDTAIATDRQKMILFIGTANATLSLTAAATLGDGWYTLVRVACNNNLTIDPAGAELISGTATVTFGPETLVLIRCDGTTFTAIVLKSRKYGALALVTATGTYTVPPDVYVLRAYAFGRGGTGSAAPFTGGGGGCAYGDIAVTPGQTINWDITTGVAKVIVGGIDMLTGNSASGSTPGTASKHASVTNGGAYSGGAGMASGGGGASSGSPLGVGVSSVSGQNGGCGWGGSGVANNGGGSGGSAPASGYAGGPAISESFPSADPLLAWLTGPAGVNGGNVTHAGNGGPGGGGGGTSNASFRAGAGGFGGGGGGNPSGPAGAGGFGGGGGKGGSAAQGGAPGYGGGAPDGGSVFGGAAAIIYFTGA